MWVKRQRTNGLDTVKERIRQRQFKKAYGRIDRLLNILEALIMSKERKVYEIEYCVNMKDGEELCDRITILADGYETAVKKAKEHALAPSIYKDDNGEEHTENFKNFELYSLKIIAEPDLIT